MSDTEKPETEPEAEPTPPVRIAKTTGKPDKRSVSSKENASKAREMLRTYIERGKQNADEFEIDLEMREDADEEQSEPVPVKPAEPVAKKEPVDGFNPDIQAVPTKPKPKKPVINFDITPLKRTDPVPEPALSPAKTKQKKKRYSTEDSSSSDSDTSEDEIVRRKVRRYKKKIKKLEKRNTKKSDQPVINVFPSHLSSIPQQPSNKYADLIRQKMMAQFGMSQ